MKECSACHFCFPDHILHCPYDGQQTYHTLVGENILDGRYQLEKRLGQGGMGIVYKAHHIFLKSPQAIKVILPELVGNDPALATRFRQEAMAAAAIRHPNIISVTDYGVIRGIMPFLVMEFIQGQSLHDLLAAEKRFSPARALEFMTVIASGVSAAHRLGIVHRDLKPLNIMLQDNKPISEAVKILDFGLAKIKAGDLLGSFVVAQTQGTMGSPHYMAPEQWSDVELDQRSDIYSLGIILFQMLTGDVPFKGVAVPTIMKKHLMDNPPSFNSLNVEIPPEIERVVDRALEKEPDMRPATAEEFVRELREAVIASESRRRAEAETMRLRIIEAQQRQEEEARRQAEAEARRRAEAERLRLEEEARMRAEAEAARIRAEEEAKRRAEEEARRHAEEEARRLAEAEARRKAEEEAARIRAAEEARLAREEEEQRQAKEARLKAEAEERERQEAEARRLAEEEAVRAKAEAEARLRAEAEARLRAEAERLRLEQEARQRTEEEARRKEAEEEAERKRTEEARLAAEEEAKRKAEEEAARLRAEEEARLRALEAARLKAEEETRLRAEEEARRVAEEEARRKAEEEERRRAEAEAKRLAEEERRREEEEARLRAEEEARLAAEAEAKRLAEAEAARLRAEEEARLVAEAKRQAAEEAARLRAEEEARRRAEDVEARLAAEAEASRFAEQETARLNEETARQEQLAATINLEEVIDRTLPAHAMERTLLSQEIEQKNDETERGVKSAPDNLEQTRLGDVTDLPAPTMLSADYARQAPSSLSDQKSTNPVLGAQTLNLSSKLPSPALTPTPSFELPAQRKTFLPIYIAAAALLLLIGGIGIYFLTQRTTESAQQANSQPSPQPTTQGKATPGGATSGSPTPNATPEREMVSLSGGTFKMGRDDGLPAESPPHSVTVKPFLIDKTEVTNAQYAEFLQATGYPPPSGEEAPDWKPWVGDKPPAGQEQWPVRNVSASDAETYAKWLSKRDGVTYRLPTEAEWEYAARSGGSANLYPWGNKWMDGYANVHSSLPRPVGSYQQGATSNGVLDMIGNVWEWTSSKASFYPGNLSKVSPDKQEYLVHRGGSYQDVKDSSGKLVDTNTATFRDWHARSYKYQTIGFRLVREAR